MPFLNIGVGKPVPVFRFILTKFNCKGEVTERVRESVLGVNSSTNHHFVVNIDRN